VREHARPVDRADQTTELLLPLTRDGARPMGAQIEEHLRQAIRSGALKPGVRVPSTRDLARQLGVSRGLVVNAYAQLGAEGYLVVRQGALPTVAEAAAREAPTAAEAPRPALPRFDFRPSMPDVSLFPRDVWLRCLKRALAEMTDEDLRSDDPRGDEHLRAALADYLGRVRGVVAAPARMVITTGYRQGEGLVCRALAAAGARRIGLENPGQPEQLTTARRAGLEPVLIGLDEDGLRVDELERADVDAVILTPAHQAPTGVPLSGERRTALLAWLRARDAIAVEDDYDAEYRYDRAAVGALQGLEPERVVYAGSTSKTLAPALRIGWLAVPSRLVDAVAEEKHLADRVGALIDQRAFAQFLAGGELDRHLRRMRVHYRARRDALVQALADELPEATVEGIAAGLHATVRLPEGDDERAIVAEAERRRIALEPMDDYREGGATGPPTLLIGYGQIAEPSIRPGIRALAEVIQLVRSQSA
jgi:GntR family transcriptional regulator / MocR family aminotransferase